MSFNKSIKHGKEHRKPYHGGKAIDKSCRNHGGCEYCLGNRTIRSQRQRESIDEQLKEWELAK